jgi:hypothetical protein
MSKNTEQAVEWEIDTEIDFSSEDRLQLAEIALIEASEVDRAAFIAIGISLVEIAKSLR